MKKEGTRTELLDCVVEAGAVVTAAAVVATAAVVGAAASPAGGRRAASERKPGLSRPQKYRSPSPLAARFDLKKPGVQPQMLRFFPCPRLGARVGVP